MFIFIKNSHYNHMEFEADLIRFFQLNMSPAWVIVFRVISMFGSLMGFAITFFIVFLKKRSLAYALFVSYFVFQLLNRVLKHLIARNRPFVDYQDIVNYDNEDGFSFPSGHSLSAGIFASYIVYVIIKSNSQSLNKALSIVLVSIISFSVLVSRMALGAHYLTDTIVGLILGILFAIISILVYNIIMKKLFFKRDYIGENNGRNIVGGD